jgi:hypothetical protein
MDIGVAVAMAARPFDLKLGPGQLLDDGFRQIFIDLVMPGHGLRLLCERVGIPIVSPPVASKNATHIFEGLDKIASFHLRDQEFLYLADIGYFARFYVF